MSDEPGPAYRRRQLGRQLRDLRLAAGFTTMSAAAEQAGLTHATISRVESAKQVITPATVLKLCHAYGVGQPMLDHLLKQAERSDDRGWLLEYSGTVPNYFERYVKEESEAIEIRGFDLGFVPGLLQTAGYIRAVTAEARERPAADLEKLVAFRQARQARLEGKAPPRLHLVVDEAAIRRTVGGAEVMREQLDHLVEMAHRPNITLQILPFGVGAHPAMKGPFKLLTFPADAGLGTIYVEVPDGALYPDGPSDYERYRLVFARLCDLALSPEDTISLLTTLRAA
ncbi:transcriptional regulator with XRE-family HTH domain [Kibdelosporangium banguiense]|uniref:Transcriptional regulator with XRE-family HTH domain n=1 Tax=Kibdelosporangium banguiense TaxID=1365924 RepID=A0ABS4U3G3_9PSEU|nr:helix-turn-helix transcriptional regulator [Kibdelosporangium banguiense]MBP2331214.1 transcriptional regulator with XRE-family HTH domain [Kibdelosporangium banguiense]